MVRYSLRATTTDDGTPVHVPVVVVAGQRERPRAVFVAGVHGDEVQGIYGLHSLLRKLDPSRLDGTLVAVMCANPLAMEASTRRAPQDGVDLNRVFPGDPSGSVSYRLADALFGEVVQGTDFVLTLHGWGRSGIVMPYAEYPTGEGAVCTASYEAARAFGLEILAPLEWESGVPDMADSRTGIPVVEWEPGTMGRAATSTGIPIVEVEIGGGATATDEYTRLYRRGMEGVLKHLGLLSGTPKKRDKPRLVGLRRVTSPVGGLLHLRVALKEQVRAGQLLGMVTDPYGDLLVELKALADGIVGGYRVAGYLNRGDGAFTIFEELETSA